MRGHTDPPGRPRVLLVTDRVPSVDTGHGLRIGNVIRGLCAAGRLHVCLIDSSTGGRSMEPTNPYEATTIRAEERPLWQKAGEALGSITNIRYRDGSDLHAALDASVGHLAWDLVWCSRVRTHVATCDLLPGPRVVDFDDLNDRLERTKLSDRRARRGWVPTAPANVIGAVAARRWYRLQQRIAAAVDHVAVCSDVDRTWLGAPNAVIIPNGYPDPGPPRPSAPQETLSILFVGSLRYEPNRLAVEWFANEVLPLVRARQPGLVFDVVGDHGGSTGRFGRLPGIVLHGWVSDVGPYYQRATMAVAPLHSGGGTRVKVIEALARGVPLVSTTFGCEGLNLVNGEELLVADSAAAFAAACLAVVDEPVLGRRLSEAGRNRFTSSMTADHCAAVVTALATQTMGRRSSFSAVEGSA